MLLTSRKFGKRTQTPKARTAAPRTVHSSSRVQPNKSVITKICLSA